MEIDNFSQDLSFTRLATANTNNTAQTASSLSPSGQISTEEFETVLNQYLTSYSNPSSKKNTAFATALGTDEALIDELLTTSRGRKAIAEMSNHHLMNVVTGDSSTNTASKSDPLKELQEQENALSKSEENTVSLSSLSAYLQQLYKRNIS